MGVYTVLKLSLIGTENSGNIEYQSFPNLLKSNESE